MLANFFEWLYQVIYAVTTALGYPGILLLMLVENLFPPIPSEFVMPFGGFMAKRGELNLIGVLVAGTMGSGLGAVIIYNVGQKYGEERLRNWVQKYGKFFLLSEKDLDRALHFFDRHGKSTILLCRLIPGLRSLISIPAGLRQMDFKQFIVLTLLGTLIWNTMLTYAGYVLGSNWTVVLDFMNDYEAVLWVIAGVLLVFFIGKRIMRKNQRATG